MKLAIFGHARTGSTLLMRSLWKHLVATGENEEWSHLGEVFTPHTYSTLIVEDGHLEIVRTTEPHDRSNNVPQMREARFKLFKLFSHHDYVMKFMSQDTQTSGIAEWMRDNYRIIAIERRNVLSAFLSSLIAYEYQNWRVLVRDKRPDYKPFVVERDVMKPLATHIMRYYRYRDSLNPSHVLYYEDIVNTSEEDIIRMAGMVPKPNHVYELPNTVKIHTFQEKMDLIENLDEVVQYFMETMAPYGIEMEHNDL